MDNDDSALRIDIRRRLMHGDLPAHRADTMWGGRGEGLSCDCCREAISLSDIMYELEYKTGEGTLRMHLQCYQLWQEEAAGMQQSDGERGGARTSGTHAPPD